MHMCYFSQVPLFETLWVVAHQAPLSMGFSRQEHWSGLPYPPPGIFLTRGWTHVSYVSLAGRFFTTSTTWEAQGNKHHNVNNITYEMLKTMIPKDDYEKNITLGVL